MKTLAMSDVEAIMVAAEAGKGRVSMIGAGPGKRQYTVLCAFMGSTAEDRAGMLDRVMCELTARGIPHRRIEGQSVVMVPMGY